MATYLRKNVSGRWVTDHSREIQFNYQLDELIDRLRQARQDFVPNSVVRCTISTDYFARIVLRGERYASRSEVSEHTSKERAKHDKALREKRDRINAALDVLRKEAPGILNRSDISAEEALEESAV